MKNKYAANNRYQKIRRTISCSCGNEVRESTRKNYPFGKKSKCRKIISFICPNCGKRQ